MKLKVIYYLWAIGVLLAPSAWAREAIGDSYREAYAQLTRAHEAGDEVKRSSLIREAFQKIEAAFSAAKDEANKKAATRGPAGTTDATAKGSGGDGSAAIPKPEEEPIVDPDSITTELSFGKSSKSSPNERKSKITVVPSAPTSTELHF